MAIEPLEHIMCNRCGSHKSVHDFYMDKRRGTRRPACKACWLANPATKGGRKTPEQRAEYRRRKGETQAEYVPRKVASEIAALRRIAKANAAAWEIVSRAGRALLHDSHVRVYRSSAVKYRRRYHGDPRFAIKERLRRQLKKKARLFPRLDDLLRAAINRRGTSNVVERVCGYTAEEAATHLERLFVDGMSWRLFAKGAIHIDHIRPQSSFNLMDEGEVRACWALSNLQPLWAVDNIKKGAKWAGGEGIPGRLSDGDG